MNLKSLLNSQWPNRIVLIISIVCSVSVGFLLTKIDFIVNHQLYNYQLQFSLAWANPYWSFLRLTYIFLGLLVALSLFALGLGFAQVRNQTPEISSTVDVTPEVIVEELKPKKENGYLKKNEERIEKQAKPETKPQKVVVEEPKSKENGGNGALIISCPSCKRVFGRPLVMLDFTGGRTRLVNVCPYCNLTLGEAEEHRNVDESVHAAEMDEKLKHRTD